MWSSSPTIFPFTVRFEIVPNDSMSTTSSSVSPVILPSTMGASPNGSFWVPVILPSTTFSSQTTSNSPNGVSRFATQVPEMSGTCAAPSPSARTMVTQAIVNFTIEPPR
jgi:hypothetical protein